MRQQLCTWSKMLRRKYTTSAGGLEGHVSSQQHGAAVLPLQRAQAAQIDAHLMVEVTPAPSRMAPRNSQVPATTMTCRHMQPTFWFMSRCK